MHVKGWFKRWRIPKAERCPKCTGRGGWWYDGGRYEFYKDDRMRWWDCRDCAGHGRIIADPKAASVGVYR